MAIGLLLLPFNLAYLGAGDYGLWVLLGSLTVHFSVFDLGFSGALVKFVAQDPGDGQRTRAERDRQHDVLHVRGGRG